MINMDVHHKRLERMFGAVCTGKIIVEDGKSTFEVCNKPAADWKAKWARAGHITWLFALNVISLVAFVVLCIMRQELKNRLNLQTAKTAKTAKTEKAVISLQAQVRGRAGKAAAKALKTEKAVITLQARVRGRAGKAAAKALKTEKALKAFNALKAEKAVITLQARVRGRAGKAAAKAEAFFNQLKVDSYQKIGDYGLVVKGADPKIQELFDWMIGLKGEGRCYVLKFIINSKTGELERSIPRKIGDPQKQVYLERMQELLPTLLGYFRQVITKHPRHNKMVISCDYRLERSGQYNFHQDVNDMPGFYGEDPPFDRKHPANINQWLERGMRFSEGLMFAYKKPKDGPILPTTIAQMTNPPPLINNTTTLSKEELVKMLEKGTVSCPAVDEGDVIIVNNQTALHATTSPDMAEALLGEGREKDYFESSTPPVMNKRTLNAPFLRIGVDTFYAP